MSASGKLTDRPVLKLAVPSPLRTEFDYWPPEGTGPDDWRRLDAGMRLLIPFGRRKVVGVLLAKHKHSHLPSQKIRCAIAVLDTTPLLPPALMKAVLWAAAYYQHPVGDVFAAVLPPRLRRPPATGRTGHRVWSAAQDTSAMDRLPARAVRQRLLLQLIQQQGPLTQAQIEAAGFSRNLLRQLEQAEVVTSQLAPAVNSSRSSTATSGPGKAMEIPNPHQLAAIEAINEAAGSYQGFLLDGVTGSGKTEVYLQAIDRVLARGLQALVLVPEIGLTPQTITRFSERFGANPAILHSGLTESERFNNWQAAASGEASIVIGTRSAVFTPLARPGIIIVDEEHDLSFKQQEGFRYSARDFALVRARQENIPVVLGSATPALESLQNAVTGKFEHLRLMQRAGAAATPELQLEDISRAELRSGVSARVLEEIGNVLHRGHQALVFINRRGFAPALLCNDCGWVFECQRCDAQMTLHRTPPQLRCHHCDAQQAVPTVCSQCGSQKLSTRGAGTEKTEMFLQQQFPEFQVVRMDRDSTRRRDSLPSILEQLAQGRPCLLVGTQMLAKGHHFPHVTLVAVLEADAGLFSPDFRGQEQMLQLLLQVAGRAGRESHPGRVIIQTRHPEHAILQHLLSQDYHAAATLLLEERRQAGMPPFSHLALFRAEANGPALPLQFLADLRQRAEAIGRSGPPTLLQITGPLPAPMERRAGRFRMQLLLQCGNRTALQAMLTGLVPAVEQSALAKKVRWSLDVDPLDLI